ncbi:right origin-binding protein [mine drainage metagenome]|uniref:Right origin-binding protein n=1 Tax=mine drainage metagenome TaxID=410659 RepID=A0A1J5RYB7_9ZZZZ
MDKDPGQAYARRFHRVLAYIDHHLDQPLDLEGLSAVAHFSKFHFHRQFSKYMGLTVGRYILLMRLKRASFRLLAEPRARIIDIALEAGFDGPAVFSRAFRQAFGQTPTAFRRHPDWMAWGACFHFAVQTHKRMDPMDVTLVTTAPVLVAVLEHRGPPALVNDSALRFIAWRKASGLSPVAASATYGIAYDDPETVPPDQFRFDLCGSIAAPVPANAHGVITKTIPGGRCAVLRHRGPHESLPHSIYPLFRDWLPASGEELRDFPLYFHYLNLKFDTPEQDLLTDIYLPLK